MIAEKRIVLGQILLIICCVFYLIWWSRGYRPGVTVNRIGGINGVLLGITALCGLAGVVLSMIGANAVPKDAAPVSGWKIALAGVITYLIMMVVTRYALARPVTTELFLITAWTCMELYLVSTLRGAGILAGFRGPLMLTVVAAAFLISMILYVLYYRMEPLKAFYSAMVPLITEACAMGSFVALICSTAVK